jgi:cation-transporting P-type ATPase E
LLLLGALARQLPTVETLKMAVVILGLVPNGLFLSISLVYALGAVRISGQGALVQQANSVESLSNVDVLCMDKTGADWSWMMRPYGGPIFWVR